MQTATHCPSFLQPLLFTTLISPSLPPVRRARVIERERERERALWRRARENEREAVDLERANRS